MGCGLAATSPGLNLPRRKLESALACPRLGAVSRDFAPMPIYAFECTACGHAYDRLQKLSDPDPSACPDCGADAVKRQLSAPSFRLSGSGWYETDFKKDGDKKRNLTEKGEGASSGATGTASKPAATTTEPKPEPKPAKAEPAAKAAPKPAAGNA